MSNVCNSISRVEAEPEARVLCPRRPGLRLPHGAEVIGGTPFVASAALGWMRAASNSTLFLPCTSAPGSAGVGGVGSIALLVPLSRSTSLVPGIDLKTVIFYLN